MFKSNVTATNKALCFVLNKGYLQTDTLEEMRHFKEVIEEKYETVIHVGNIDKIKLDDTNKIVYRQRFFFKNLQLILDVCKYYGFTFEVDKDFEITINNIINCQSDLKYLEIYAKKFNETITQYLTNTCMVYISDFLKVSDVMVKMPKDMNKCLEGKKNYLERAPFLVVSYSIDKKESGIFIWDKNFKDNRKFDVQKQHTADVVDYGFTEEMIEADIKDKAFKL